MKSPIFGKEKLLYFPQKSGIVPIFKKSPSSYISYFCHHAPCPRWRGSVRVRLHPAARVPLPAGRPGPPRHHLARRSRLPQEEDPAGHPPADAGGHPQHADHGQEVDEAPRRRPPAAEGAPLAPTRAQVDCQRHVRLHFGQLQRQDALHRGDGFVQSANF